jgi:hypothetical protein
VPGLHHAMLGALGGHGKARELAGEAGGEGADVDHLLDLAVAFGEEFAGFYGDEAAKRVDVGAQFFAEETDEFAAFGGRDSAPFEKGGVSLRDGFGCIGSGDGRELRDDFAGEWGVDDEGSVEWSGNAEMSENFGDFGLDGHCGLGLA